MIEQQLVKGHHINKDVLYFNTETWKARERLMVQIFLNAVL